jgi:methionine-rich copper-binding protein CopC
MLKSVLFALVAILAVFAGRDALAHAVLVESTPSVEAKVAGAKVDFHLRYNSRIDVKRSRLSLKGPGGAKTITPLPGGNEAEVKALAEGLAPGRYILFWDVLSVDGHVSRGQVPFAIISP